MLITDVVEDSVQNQPQMFVTQRRGQPFECGLATASPVDRVVIAGVVFVGRGRLENGREIDGVATQRLDVTQPIGDCVEPAPGGHEDLIDGTHEASLYSLARFFPSPLATL